MKYLICLLLILSPLQAVCDECTFFDELSHTQKENAYNSFRAGEPYDLGYTMVAIAWKESKLGVYKVRYSTKISDQSFGMFHTVAKWKVKGMSSFRAGMWVQNIVENDIISIQYGLADLLYWLDRNDGNWYKAVGAYNGGNRPNKKYSDDIVKIVNELKKCEI